MMDFNEFTEWAEENIKDYLPETYTDAEVSVTPFRKIGKSYTALSVRLNSNSATPAISLEEMFDGYIKGVPLEEIGKKMGEIAQQVPLDIISERASYVIDSYENIKDNLFIRLCNAEDNKEFLKTVPHKRIEDLAVTYSINFGETVDNLVSATVTNSIMESLHIDAEQLHKDAIENAQRILPERIVKLSTMIGNPDDDFQSERAPYVLTNSVAINGASAIMYPGVMEELQQKIGGGYYVCPSSQHELIIVPDTNSDTEKLREIVRDTNEAFVPEKDFLSNNVYHCDGEKLELGEKYEQRMQAKADIVLQDEPDLRPSHRMRM